MTLANLAESSKTLGDSSPMSMDRWGNIIGYLNYAGDSRDYEFCELPPAMKKVMLRSLHFWLVLNSATALHDVDPDIQQELVRYALTHPSNQ